MHIQTVATRWDVFVGVGDELMPRWAGEVVEESISEYRAEMRTGARIGTYKTRQSAQRALARAFAKYIAEVA